MATRQLPEDSTQEDTQAQFLPDHVNTVLKGQRFSEGNLCPSVDHASSPWLIKENDNLKTSWLGRRRLTWPEMEWVLSKGQQEAQQNGQCIWPLKS